MTMQTLPTPEQAFEMYQGLVENSEQAIPLLVYGAKDGAVAVGLDFGGMPAQMVLEAALPDLAEKFGPASWLLFSSEVWSREFKSEEEMHANARPGQLQRDKEAGSEEVHEQVAIVAVTSDGMAWQYHRGFERVDGKVTWGEGGETHMLRGGIADILLHAVR